MFNPFKSMQRWLRPLLLKWQIFFLERRYFKNFTGPWKHLKETGPGIHKIIGDRDYLSYLRMIRRKRERRKRIKAVLLRQNLNREPSREYFMTAILCNPPYFDNPPVANLFFDEFPLWDSYDIARRRANRMQRTLFHEPFQPFQPPVVRGDSALLVTRGRILASHYHTDELTDSMIKDLRKPEWMPVIPQTFAFLPQNLHT